jgi:phosphohistidine phosphatase SixA
MRFISTCAVGVVTLGYIADGSSLPGAVSSGLRSITRRSRFKSMAFTDGVPPVSKKVVFIRHAQSDWNAANEDISKIAGAFSRDSPLSEEGVRQSESLAEWMEKSPEASCVAVPPSVHDPSSEPSCDADSEIRDIVLSPSTKWASSNLKRALLTGIIAMRSRINSGEPDKVHILSALQEISYGIDARASVGIGSVPDVKGDAENLNVNVVNLEIDGSLNFGNMNKIIGMVPKSERFRQFCDWVNSQESSQLVIVGHSAWLNEFFIAAASTKGEMNSAEQILTEGQTKLGNASVLYFELTNAPDTITPGCAFVHGKTQLVYGTWHGGEK